MRATTKIKNLLKIFDIKLTIENEITIMTLVEKKLKTEIEFEGKTYPEVSEKAYKYMQDIVNSKNQ